MISNTTRSGVVSSSSNALRTIKVIAAKNISVSGVFGNKCNISRDVDRKPNRQGSTATVAVMGSRPLSQTDGSSSNIISPISELSSGSRLDSPSSSSSRSAFSTSRTLNNITSSCLASLQPPSTSSSSPTSTVRDKTALKDGRRDGRREGGSRVVREQEREVGTRARERTRKWKHANKHTRRVKWMERGGEGVDEKYLMKRVLDLSRRRQLTQLLAELRVQKTRPSTRIYNAAINACCLEGQIEQAFDLLYFLENDGPGSDVVSYGTLMKGLGRAGRMDDAWLLMERWEIRMRRRVERSKRFLSMSLPSQPVPADLLYSLVNACAEAGDVARAKAVLYRFNGSFIQSERVYNMLIKACARSPTPLRALEILQDMTRVGISPSRVTYNSLLHACSAAARADLCHLILNIMHVRADRESSKELLPDVNTYTAVLTAEARAALAETKRRNEEASSGGQGEGGRSMGMLGLEELTWEEGEEEIGGRLGLAAGLRLPSLQPKKARCWIRLLNQSAGWEEGDYIAQRNVAGQDNGREGAEDVNSVVWEWGRCGEDLDQRTDTDNENQLRNRTETQLKEGSPATEATEENEDTEESGDVRVQQARLVRVLRLAEEMRDRAGEISLDRVALTALVQACVAAGAVEHGVHFLKEMQALGLKPRPAVYLLVLKGLKDQGFSSLPAVQACSAAMMQHCSRISAAQRAQAAVCVADVAIQAGQFKMAQEALESLQAAVARKGSSPCGDSWNKALSLLVAIYVHQVREEKSFDDSSSSTPSGSLASEEVSWTVAESFVIVDEQYEEFFLPPSSAPLSSRVKEQIASSVSLDTPAEDLTSETVWGGLPEEGEEIREQTKQALKCARAQLEPILFQPNTLPGKTVKELITGSHVGSRPVKGTMLVGALNEIWKEEMCGGGSQEIKWRLVVDAEGRSVGTVNKLQCKIAQENDFVSSIMTPTQLPKIFENSTVADAAMTILKCNELGAQVVDGDNVVLGSLALTDILQTTSV